MKVRRVICRSCGHEDKVEVFTREEADRKHMQLMPVTCPKCGSRNVIVQD
jgi:DNA-directed RNA polymerase subunit RPC12/RpoP